MTFEPVGTTLAVLGFLKPIFVTCRELYKGYRVTQLFGEDFDIAKRRLETQHAMLEATSMRMGFLNNDSQASDNNDPILKAIIRHLFLMKRHFQICNEVLEKYRDIVQEEIDQTNNATTTTIQDPGIEETLSAIHIPQSVLRPTVKNSSPDETAQSSPSESFVKKLRQKLRRLEHSSGRSRLKSPENSLPSRGQSPEPVSTITSTPGATVEGTSYLRSTSLTSLGHHSEIPTPDSTSSPSILGTKPVWDDENLHRDRAKKLQASNRFLRRAAWAAKHKAQIYSKLDELDKYFIILDSLLKLTPLEESQEVIASRDWCAGVREPSQIQASVKCCHKALASMKNGDASFHPSLGDESRQVTQEVVKWPMDFQDRSEK